MWWVINTMHTVLDYYYILRLLLAGFPGGTCGKEPTSQFRRCETQVWPLGREAPGGGQGNSLQRSCLENPMDRGAWWATVHRVAKIQTGLKRLSMHAHSTSDTVTFPREIAFLKFCFTVFLMKLTWEIYNFLCGLEFSNSDPLKLWTTLLLHLFECGILKGKILIAFPKYFFFGLCLHLLPLLQSSEKVIFSSKFLLSHDLWTGFYWLNLPVCW